MARRDSSGGKTKRGGVRGLAELISAVLRHPDCPVPLYNKLVDQLCEYSADVTSPEHVAGWLEQQRAEAAGARTPRRGKR